MDRELSQEFGDFSTADIFGNRLDSLDTTIPSLIAYLTLGPESHQEAGPTPIGGWNFKFELWILDYLLKGLKQELEEIIDPAKNHKLHLLLDKENPSPSELERFHDFILTAECIGQAVELVQGHISQITLEISEIQAFTSQTRD